MSSEKGPPVCKACGYLMQGPPEEEIDDIQGEHNPSDPHLEEFQKSDEDDTRLRCKRTGQTSAIIPKEEYEDQQADDTVDRGPGTEQKSQKSGGGGRPRGSGGGDVFEFDDDKEPIDILIDVVNNPSYGLSDAQINEIKDWADVYEGQMNPDLLESILKDMKGVSKQQASLMSRKYEAKMQKYAREVSNRDNSPPVGGGVGFFGVSSGASATRPSKRPAKGPRKPRPSSTSSDSSSDDSDDDEDDSSSSKNSRARTRADIREERKKRRLERRDEAMNTMMNEAAEEFAKQNAAEFGQGFFRMRNIFFTLLEKKAEKDPEAFFKIMDKYDIDIMEFFAEGSGEMEGEPAAGDAGNPADEELDEIEKELLSKDVDQNTQEGNARTQSKEPVHDTEPNPMKGEPTGDDEEDDGFDEVFGDMASED